MKIILNTDGSEFSRAAVEKCCRVIAAPAETSVRIVSVYEIVEPLDISISPEFAREMETSARGQADGFVAEAVAVMRAQCPEVELTTQVTRGAPDQVLIETAREWGADLLVTGSHGRGFWQRMLLGSITDSLVHHAPCSVLVVRRA
jgi:nucleotide-binding universal stress UspA family protein